MDDIAFIWQEMLSKLEVEVNSLGFDIWIRPLRPVGVDNDTLVVAAPTEAFRGEVVARYMPLFRRILRDLELDDAPTDISVISAAEKSKENLSSTTAAIAAVTRVEKEEEEARKIEPSTLNPKYNFEGFVVGKCNEMAYAAACAVVEAPGEVYNPLFIYGDVGLGKTHIMQAIGNAIRLSMKQMKVLYVSSETFMNEFIESIRMSKNGSNTAFREKYRNVDLLIIDDVQFLSKKPSTQEEIFHTFEALKAAGKQMIFASDRAPQDIPDLDARVRSRFTSSLVVDMGPPDYETRIAILKTKAREAKFKVDNNILAYIAECVSGNIRELEGILTKVIFLTKLRGGSATLDICNEALHDYKMQKSDEITADEIIDCTCKYYNVAKADIVGKKRNKEIVEPRQVAIYLICDMMPMPLISVGELFGGKEHTTVSYSRDKVATALENDSRLRTAVNDIKAMVLRK